MFRDPLSSRTALNIYLVVRFADDLVTSWTWELSAYSHQKTSSNLEVLYVLLNWSSSSEWLPLSKPEETLKYCANIHAQACHRKITIAIEKHSCWSFRHRIANKGFGPMRDASIRKRAEEVKHKILRESPNFPNLYSIMRYRHMSPCYLDRSMDM